MRLFYAVAVAGLTCLPLTAHAQETLAGLGAASGIAAGMGAMAATNIVPSQITKGIGSPRLPSVDEGPGTTRTTTSAAVGIGATAVPASRSNGVTGQSILSELMSSRGGARPIPTRRQMTARQRATYLRRLARMTPAQRTHMVMAKYHLPPRGWLAAYLPQDRYKVSSSLWSFVTIEDDAGAYPVKYYYRPSSDQMLGILSHTPRSSQRRANRVIGFRNWQDAMLAGYRPDPISKPEPANGIYYMARLARTPSLAEYVERVYAGEVSPQNFAFSVAYVQQVERIVRSHSDTRPLLGQTMAQIYDAFIGQGSLPTSVGVTQPAAVVTGGGAGRLSAEGGPIGPTGPRHGVNGAGTSSHP